MKCAHVERKAIRAWYRRMYDRKPAQANAIMRVGRVCFEHAIIEGEITQNPFVNGGAKLVHPGGAKLVHLMLCGTRCWGVFPVVHRRDPRCFV